MNPRSPQRKIRSTIWCVQQTDGRVWKQNGRNSLQLTHALFTSDIAQMCNVWSTIQSIFMALLLFDFHNIPWSELAHVIIVNILCGNWDSGKLRRTSSFGVRSSYEKMGQHHPLEWVGTLCTNTPFHWGRGIGLGPKQGEKWMGVSGMWTSWNPKRPSHVPVTRERVRSPQPVLGCVGNTHVGERHCPSVLQLQIALGSPWGAGTRALLWENSAFMWEESSTKSP